MTNSHANRPWPATQPVGFPGMRCLAAATAGLPVTVTAVLAGSQDLAIVITVAAASCLAAAVAAIVAELPRLYWISACMRLVTKGAAVAGTAAEVAELMAGLSAACCGQGTPRCREFSPLEPPDCS